MASRIFVLGGTRSGKSRYGRDRARSLGGDAVTYVATAWRGDAELEERIAAHQADRPAAWETIEAGADLADAVAGARLGNVLLVDSLTLWVSAVSPERLAAAWSDARRALAARATAAVLVSDEVGLGIVPDTPVVRRFRDDLGRVNQDAAALADEVVLLVAGCALRLKGPPSGPLGGAPNDGNEIPR